MKTITKIVKDSDILTPYDSKLMYSKEDFTLRIISKEKIKPVHILAGDFITHTSKLKKIILQNNIILQATKKSFYYSCIEEIIGKLYIKYD